MNTSKPIVDVVIPAFNEEHSLPHVIQDIPKSEVRCIVVADNNSIDDTAKVAKEAGAIVVPASQQGYGSACLAGLDFVANQEHKPDIVVFIDADYSDHPEELTQLIAPIIAGKADMVIGSRALGKREQGSMMPQQIFGNWLATSLLKMLYGVSYTDLGPFRAIRYTSLQQLKMKDPNYGWTVEMQLKAARQKLSIIEIPVSYRKRIGTSKIAGTLKGTILAGYKIIYTIFKYR